jgi:hypothetical protein
MLRCVNPIATEGGLEARTGWAGMTNPAQRGLIFICKEKIGRRGADNNELSVVFSLGLQLLTPPYPALDRPCALGNNGLPRHVRPHRREWPCCRSGTNPKLFALGGVSPSQASAVRIARGPDSIRVAEPSSSTDNKLQTRLPTARSSAVASRSGRRSPRARDATALRGRIDRSRWLR